MKNSTVMTPYPKVYGVQYVRHNERNLLDFVGMLLPGESEAISAIDVSEQTDISTADACRAIHTLSHFGMFEYVGRLNDSLRVYFSADTEKVAVLQNLLTKVKGFGFTAHQRTMVSVASLALRLGYSPYSTHPEMAEILRHGSTLRKHLMLDEEWFSTHKGAQENGRVYTFVPSEQMIEVALVWRTIGETLDRWREQENASHVFLMPEIMFERPHLHLVPSFQEERNVTATQLFARSL